MNNKLIKTAMLGAIALTMGCKGGSSGQSTSNVVLFEPGSKIIWDAQDFVDELNYLSTSSFYTLEKDKTIRPGYIVIDDGYDYIAVDLYDVDGFFYTAEDAAWDYYTGSIFGPDEEIVDWVSYLQDADGYDVFKDIWGNLYSATKQGTFDLEQAGAFFDEIKTKARTGLFSNQYNLGESAARRMAEATMDFDHATKNGRFVDESKVDAIVKPVLGWGSQDLKAAVKALESNNAAPLAQLRNRTLNTLKEMDGQTEEGEGPTAEDLDRLVGDLFFKARSVTEQK